MITLPQLIANAVETDPDGVALVLADGTGPLEQVTYADLDAWSSRLARALIARGIGPEDLVAVAIPRSLDAVLAIWAVAKTGAGFVPIDPAYPPGWVAHLLVDAGAVYGLAVSWVRTELPEEIEWLQVDTVDTARSLEQFSAEAVTYADRIRPLRAEHPAYVTYAADGETLPDGIVVTQAGLSGLCSEQQGRYRVEPEDRTLNFAPLPSDSSVLELLLALGGAATMVVVSPLVSRADELAALLQRTGVTHAYLPADALELIDPTGLDELGVVITGRRPCPPETVQRWAIPVTGGSPRALYQGYGPAEATIMTSISSPLTPGGPRTLGTPIRGVAAHILDERLAAVPDGAVGELYLGGPQLARGYHRRPGQTAQLLVADPFAGDGSRLYRTGDLVRRGPGGAMEYVGRIELPAHDGSAAISRPGRAETAADQAGPREVTAEPAALPADELPDYAQSLPIRDAASPGGRVIGADSVAYGSGPSDPGSGSPGTSEPAVSDLAPGSSPEPVSPDRSSGGNLDRHSPESLPETGSRLASEQRDMELRGRGYLEIPDRRHPLGASTDDWLRSGRQLPGPPDGRGGYAPIPTDATAFYENPLSAVHEADHPAERDTAAARPAQPLSSRPDWAVPPAWSAESELPDNSGAGPAAPSDPDTATDDTRPAGPPSVVERPAIIPLSPGQRQWWDRNRTAPDTAVETITAAMRLTGNLDATAMQAAVADVVDRHETLRTVYPEVGGEPQQVVLPREQAVPEVVAEPVPAAELAEWLDVLAHTDFDAADAEQVPVRFALAELGPREHVVAVVVHRILADDVSAGLLLRDLLRAFLGRRNRSRPLWQPLSIQYLDYFLGRRAELGDIDNRDSLAARRLAYWREYLAELPARLEFPAGTAAGATGEGVHAFDIGTRTHRRIADIAQRAGTSEFIVLRAAFTVLLARSAAVADIVLGSSVRGSDERELDDAIGPYANTVVLRTRIDPAESFLDLVQRIAESDRRTFANADLPFELLTAALGLDGPLFDVAISLRHNDIPRLEMPSLATEPVEVPATSVGAALRLVIDPHRAPDGSPDGIAAAFRFAADRIGHTAVAEVARRFQRVLTVAGGDPDGPVGDIDLLSRADLDRLLVVWNDTRYPVAPELLLDGYRRTVAIRPDTVAVADAETELSYQEFDGRVNRLARRLIEAGVGAETVVGIATRYTPDLVVAIYAVLTAGGAYLPLDPRDPARWTAQVIDAATPALVLADRASESRVAQALHASRRSAPVLLVDSGELGQYATEPLRPAELTRPARPGNAACVMCVSTAADGPELAVLTHTALNNQITLRLAQTPLGFTDVYLQRNAATAATSLWGFFLPLRAGAELVLTRPADARRIAETITAYGVTVTDFGPAELAEFAGLIDPDRVGSLREIFVTGEPLSPEIVSALRARSAAQVHNLYGTCETAVSATSWPAAGSIERSVPIGLPQWNTRVYVLDSRLRPVPPGVPGELYLAGDQLARGYADRAGLTAARFVANPFGYGQRMYRTGDLVLWRDATHTTPQRLDLLGRTDHQIRFRGHRIRPHVIADALRTLPGIADAAVLARTAAAGSDPTAPGSRLAAYVVSEHGAGADLEQVRAGLARLLPAALLPVAFQTVERIALNPAGEPDTDRLPNPDDVPMLPSALEPAPADPVAQPDSRAADRVAAIAEARPADTYRAADAPTGPASPAGARTGAAHVVRDTASYLPDAGSVVGSADPAGDSGASATPGDAGPGTVNTRLSGGADTRATAVEDPSDAGLAAIPGGVGAGTADAAAIGGAETRATADLTGGADPGAADAGVLGGPGVRIPAADLVRDGGAGTAHSDMTGRGDRGAAESGVAGDTGAAGTDADVVGGAGVGTSAADVAGDVGADAAYSDLADPAHGGAAAADVVGGVANPADAELVRGAGRRSAVGDVAGGSAGDFEAPAEVGGARAAASGIGAAGRRNTGPAGGTDTAAAGGADIPPEAGTGAEFEAAETGGVGGAGARSGGADSANRIAAGTSNTPGAATATVPEPQRGPEDEGEHSGGLHVSGELPVTPTALRLLGNPLPGVEVRSIVLDLPAGRSLDHTEAVVRALVTRHPMLSARLDSNDRTPALWIPPRDQRGDRPYWWLDPESGENTVATDDVVQAAADALDPATGRNIHFVVTGAESARRLVVVANGLVVDDRSWRVIVDELIAGETAPAIAESRLPQLVQALDQRARSIDLLDEAGWWRRNLAGARTAAPLGAVDLRARRRVSLAITAEGTAAVTAAADAYQATVPEVLLTAVAIALRTGEQGAVVRTLGSLVRCDADARSLVSRSADLVGGFATEFPLSVQVADIDTADALVGGPAAGAALTQIRDLVRSVPGGGAGYALLRYLNAETTAEFAAADSGRFTLRYRDLRPARVHTDGPADGVPLVLTVDVTDEGLLCRFDYATEVFVGEDVKTFAEHWVRALGGLAEHGLRPTAPAPAPQVPPAPEPYEPPAPVSDAVAGSDSLASSAAGSYGASGSDSFGPGAAVSDAVAGSDPFASSAAAPYSAAGPESSAPADSETADSAAGPGIPSHGQPSSDLVPPVGEELSRDRAGQYGEISSQVPADRDPLPDHDPHTPRSQPVPDAEITSLLRPITGPQPLAAGPGVPQRRARSTDSAPDTPGPAAEELPQRPPALADVDGGPAGSPAGPSPSGLPQRRPRSTGAAAESAAGVLPQRHPAPVDLDGTAGSDSSGLPQRRPRSTGAVAESAAAALPQRQPAPGDVDDHVGNVTRSGSNGSPQRPMSQDALTQSEPTGGSGLPQRRPRGGGQAQGREGQGAGASSLDPTGRPPLDETAGDFANQDGDVSRPSPNGLPPERPRFTDVAAEPAGEALPQRSPTPAGLDDRAENSALPGSRGLARQQPLAQDAGIGPEPAAQPGLPQRRSPDDSLASEPPTGSGLPQRRPVSRESYAENSASLPERGRAAVADEPAGESGDPAPGDVGGESTADPEPTTFLRPVADVETTAYLSPIRDLGSRDDDNTLLSLFDEQVARTPADPAVRQGARLLSYAELDRKSRALSVELIRFGVGAQTPVAVAMRPGIDLVVAVCAVLRAGGAYVPVDPGGSADGLDRVLAAAEPICVLSISDDGVTTGTGIPVVAIDLLYLDLPTDPAADPVVAADDIADIRYRPDTAIGVAGTHRQMVERLRRAQRSHPYDSADLVLHAAPTVGDITLWELFRPLHSGAQILMPDHPGRAADLSRSIAANRVTIVHVVPALLDRFLDSVTDGGGRATHPSLRRLVVDGAALPSGGVERFMNLLPGAELVIWYGHDETGVITVGSVGGRPVTNDRVYLLDDRMRPVPPGTAGEMYIGGPQLARGFYAVPGETAVRFVAAAGGGRLYRTGDIVRRRDGVLEYLGRVERNGGSLPVGSRRGGHD
ncbi:AMP-binding protein [Nocardia carnea]|uniref:AMP-binding protein n=2 Tax=Bacteria TaxID=2 RepID=UPI0024560F1F|nr:AMP-binding protein [Nocardia carnea]